MTPRASAVTAVPISMEHIARSCGFTLEDLALNRAGKVSPHQLSNGYAEAAGIGGAFLVTLGVAMVVAFFGKAGYGRAIGVVVCAVAAITGAAIFWKAMVGACKHKVASVEGSFELTRPGSNMRSGVVGTYQWSFSSETGVPAVLVRGARYRVFYLAGSNHFLSIEPLGPGSDAPLPGGSR